VEEEEEEDYIALTLRKLWEEEEVEFPPQTLRKGREEEYEGDF
jgi:hypothetical protein